ncbi:hypothetical protein OEZ86_012959 [Tetradesmus obliquus]|uniref:Cytochrome c-553 n=1 Tax=Tetradesmus obliquus TaxID=3088 RepID=A0ABY8U476_TETOB|nr:hypothetical protein OEZ85_002988 [Tetradesmus obliquus]WIA34642.1 hypothetical protein OEZ86_012959 [Tetradesmus obliquus]
MHCSIRTGLRPTAAGPAKVGRAACIRPQAVRSEAAADRQADSWASIAATGALTALVAAATLLSSSAAQAGADLALGKQTFEANCAACHAGGNNSVIPDHTLRKAAMEQFLQGGFNLEAITYQVENGKGAMPAWSGTLDDDEIAAVAAYVYDQASGDKW